jgi:hypothetical protein
MINIVVPMAGNGSRFVKTGQIIPKPLIEVLHGKRMIDRLRKKRALGGFDAETGVLRAD